MFVQLGASGLAGNRLYLGNLHQQFFRAASHLVRFVQGDTRKGTDVNRERPFVERRQEATSQRKESPQGNNEQGYRTAQHNLFMR